MSSRRATLALLLGCGCAVVGNSGADLTGVTPRDLVLAPQDDAAGPGLDAHQCQLGSADDCGMCGNVCPPGSDTASTLRTCSANTVFGTCDITCRGESYDVDGKDANGCEALDEPLQDSAATAVHLVLGDTNNTMNVVDEIYGDGRLHETTPSQRPNGRADWFSVDVAGTGSTQTTLVACLGITSFPPDNVFQVCVSDIGVAAFSGGACQTVLGGASSVCVYPPAHTDAGGPYYVRVLKVEGTTTLNKYALFLQH